MQDRPGYTKEMVQAEAHHLWCEDGCPDGDDLKYWYLAEQNLDAERVRHDPKLDKLWRVLNGESKDALQ